MSSVIEYQWIKVYKDRDGNEKFVPQFRSDGTQQHWYDSIDIKPHKLIIAPLSQELASNMQKNKIPGCAVSLPSYNFFLKENDDIIAYWDNAIHTTSHFHCTTCNTNWKHTDSTKWAKCPRCGEVDVWGCKNCGRENIDNTLVHKNNRGETNCPYCPEPYGLNRIRRLERIQDIIENTDYAIEVKNRYKIIIRENIVDVFSI